MMKTLENTLNKLKSEDELLLQVPSALKRASEAHSPDSEHVLGDIVSIKQEYRWCPVADS